MLRRATGAVLGTALLAAALAPGASAKVKCDHDATAHRLAVEWTKKADNPSIQVDGTEIEVRNAGAPVPDITCAGGVPFTNDTDRIVVRDRSDASTGFTIFEPGDFEPGFSEAGGDAGTANDEIEIDIRMGSGRRDSLEANGNGDSTAQIWGRRSMNPGLEILDPSPDGDVFFTGVERVSALNEGDQPDLVAGDGGLGTGGPLRLPMRLELHGGEDTLRGGSGGDYLEGGDDADLIGGGGGRDTVNYRFTSPSGVQVTIGSGAGDDGSSDDGPVGDRDTVDGDVENVIGTDFPDTLIGSPVANKLVGGTGADQLQGLGGRDSLRARDGLADTLIDCGPGRDSVRFDAGLDPSPISC